MNYAKIKKDSVGNWLGISVSLYCSGCPFHCKGCFQSETWNPKYGEEFTDEVKEEIFKELEKPYYDNLVLLGGEPLAKYNVETMTEVAREFKNRFTMATNSTKRRLITSFHNLTPEQQAEVKALYPLGFGEVMMRYDKPDGTFFYTVPYETEDTFYMVKIDVKVDDGADDVDEGYYDDDLKGADELADASEELSDDEY
jgi:hypothetical protein